MNRWPPVRPLTYKPRNEERLTSLQEFDVDGGETIIAVFQGGRGGNPDLDLIVKYRQRGTNLRTPQHVHWAIDLLVKKQHREDLTIEFVEFLVNLYDGLQPFASQAERARRLGNRIGLGVNEAVVRFQELEAFGDYSIEFTAYILELMGITEKTGNPNAFMFRGVLSAILEGESIFSVVSKAAFNRR